MNWLWKLLDRIPTHRTGWVILAYLVVCWGVILLVVLALNGYPASRPTTIWRLELIERAIRRLGNKTSCSCSNASQKSRHSADILVCIYPKDFHPVSEDAEVTRRVHPPDFVSGGNIAARELHCSLLSRRVAR